MPEDELNNVFNTLRFRKGQADANKKNETSSSSSSSNPDSAQKAQRSQQASRVAKKVKSNPSPAAQTIVHQYNGIQLEQLIAAIQDGIAAQQPEPEPEPEPEPAQPQLVYVQRTPTLLAAEPSDDDIMRELMLFGNSLPSQYASSSQNQSGSTDPLNLRRLPDAAFQYNRRYQDY